MASPEDRIFLTSDTGNGSGESRERAVTEPTIPPGWTVLYHGSNLSRPEWQEGNAARLDTDTLTVGRGLSVISQEERSQQQAQSDSLRQQGIATSALDTPKAFALDVHGGMNQPIELRIIFPALHSRQADSNQRKEEAVSKHGEERVGELVELADKVYWNNSQGGRHPVLPQGMKLRKLQETTDEDGARTVWYVPQALYGMYQQESQSKRFPLPRNPLAVERRKGLQATVREYIEQNPEALAFTVYGSLVKNRTRKQSTALYGTPEKSGYRTESDIDGTLYVDAGEVQGQYPDEENIVHFEHGAGGTTVAEFRPDIAERYRASFVGPLQQRLKLTDEQVNHISITPISREIINRLLGEWQQAMQTYEVYQGDPEAEGAPAAAGPSSTLSDMFHLAVGRRDLQQYRVYLLDRLQCLGEAGEKMWQKLMEVVERGEQDMTVDHNRQYPRTLSDAYRVYGS